MSICFKLFYGLGSSTVLHEAPVWAPGQIEEIEKFQGTFHKRFLLFPTNTPAYAVRVEFKLDTMEIRCIKVVLVDTKNVGDGERKIHQNLF